MAEYLIVPAGGDYYSVTSPEGRTYSVNLAAETCDCADYLYRGQERPCKHVEMVKRLLERGVIAHRLTKKAAA